MIKPETKSQVSDEQMSSAMQPVENRSVSGKFPCAHIPWTLSSNPLKMLEGNEVLAELKLGKGTGKSHQ